MLALVKRRPMSLSPSFVARDVNHVLISGQSLSTGTQGYPALSVAQPYDNLMFNTGVRAGYLGSSFVPLAETNNGDVEGETIASGMANLSTELAQGLGEAAHVLLMSCHGVGSYAYAQLKKGTAVWDNMTAQVTNAKNIATGADLTHIVRGVLIVHGESDCANHNENYDDNLVEWQADYDTDVKALTGQSDSVAMFITQLSSWWIVGGTVSLALQQLAASVASAGKIVMVGPKYQFAYTDGLHMNAENYRWLGEYYAKAYRRVILEGLPWEPVRPRSVRRTGASIDVHFHVPVRPLALDTVRVSNPGHFGFEYTDDSGAPPSITMVKLTSPSSLRVSLSTAPTGANQRLKYACASGTYGGPATGPRGCLRDSDTTVSRNGKDLFNWCVHFDEPVTSVDIG